MMKLRILFMGYDEVPESLEDEQVTKVQLKSLERDLSLMYGFRFLPAIYDFHIVILSPMAVSWSYEWLKSKYNEFYYFLKAPFKGVMVVPIVGGNEYYEWCPCPPSLVDACGEGVVFNEKHFLASLLKKYRARIQWQAHAKYTITSSQKELRGVIAFNIAGNPIAFEKNFGNGTIIYLPNMVFINDKEELLFLRELVNKIKGKCKVNELTPPHWISHQEYSLKREKQIELEIKKLKDEKSDLEKVKSILWMSGTQLTENVAFVLEQLGISCNTVEREGRHDIEIDEEALKAIVEVTGLDKYADVSHLRQLLDWYDEKLKEDENIKGIFILNEFKKIEPRKRRRRCKEALQDRDYPFTRDAERIAKRKKFALLTTFQLFQLFRRKLEGEFDKNQFLKKIKEASGFVQI